MSAPLSALRLHVRPRGAEHDVLRDVSLALREGEMLAVVGPNGSGKSTLLAALASSLELRAGEVRAGETRATDISRRAFARRVAWLPQQPQVAQGFTVEALVMQGRHAHRPFLAPPTARDRNAVGRALRALDLLDLRERRVETLSGGERRRAWLAMALCQEAPVLLLDEPTAALDLRHQWEVLALLARINREQGLTLGVVLHDLEQAAALAHRLAIIHRGRLYAIGPPEACLTPETLRDVWRIDADVSKEDGFLRLRVRGPADPIRSL
ncbi:MAG: ABC transporter ATP-binding protein [Deltaproteobacteria bacterium]|nr:ABC transporter ATP-binding protein [Deltaproteobacteria bacterium]